MPAARKLDPNASRTAAFGAELRRMREEAQLTQAELGRHAGYSSSQIGAVEVGKRPPTEQFLTECERALGSGLRELWASLSRHRDTAPTWFAPWLQEEEQAQSLRTWQPLVIPGLLQTADYARALLEGESGHDTERIDALVAARLARQQILTRTNPPRYLVVLDEGVLNRPVGGPAVMREQLERLLESARVPHITLQVCPLGANPGLSGGIVIAQALTGTRHTVYLETAAEPVVTSYAEVVELVSMKLDAIRADALPQRASVEFIRKMVEKWT
ncbi:helix-turn-helix domain-containing protein [Nonomuraea sp. NPDC004297]